MIDTPGEKTTGEKTQGIGREKREKTGRKEKNCITKVVKRPKTTILLPLPSSRSPAALDETLFKGLEINAEYIPLHRTLLTLILFIFDRVVAKQTDKPGRKGLQIRLRCHR